MSKRNIVANWDVIDEDFINDFINLPENSIINQILSIKINFAWMFYIVSQTLISLSCAFIKKQFIKKACSCNF